MKRRVRLSVTGLAIGASATMCPAITEDLGTAAPGRWTVTGAGAVNAPAFAYAPLAGVALTSTATGAGSFPAGGSLAAFDGVWYAETHFTLPSFAAGASLTFSGLSADDRVVLELNGSVVGDYFLFHSESNPPLTGPGLMSLSFGPHDAPFAFTGITSGTLTNGPVAGGDNVLRMIVNNTFDASLMSPTRTVAPSGDGTHAQLAASVFYSVPEPAGIALFLPFVALSVRRRR